MNNWDSLTLAQKCFNGLSYREILTVELYDLLSEGKDFRVRNGVVEDIPLEVELTADEVVIYTHKTSGVYILANGAHIAIPYEDFYKGYAHVINVLIGIDAPIPEWCPLDDEEYKYNIELGAVQ